jgi:hypothetical protein
MNDVKKPSEKEIYRLWWEYLKRSEKYKNYCDFIREFSKIKIKKGETDKSPASDKLIKSSYTLELDELEFDYMHRNYEYFGNIFTNSFDEWWKMDKTSQHKLPVIVLNDPNAYKSLPFFAGEFRKQQKAKKKSLSPEEMLKILIEKEYEFIFLAVPMVGGVTMDDISKQIANIRKKWAKDFDIEDFNSRRFSRPVSRVRYTELKRYLRVYDLKKQGLKMKEVIAQINPDQKGDSANVLRSFYMDLQKAKKIIENVESGSFPEEPQF